MNRKKKGIFITATGTDIGKTYITALIIKKLRDNAINAGYYKAALSGANLKNRKLIPGDAEYVAAMSGISMPPEKLVSYIYEPPVSPHLAAKMEQYPIVLDKIKADFQKIQEQFEIVVAEGSGGIVCPLRMDNQRIMLTDVIKALQLPVLIVADAGLGTINSTVLTVEYAKSAGIEIKGILLNQYEEKNPIHQDNHLQIETLTDIPIIAHVKQHDTNLKLDITTLLQLCGN